MVLSLPPKTSTTSESVLRFSMNGEGASGLGLRIYSGSLDSSGLKKWRVLLTFAFSGFFEFMMLYYRVWVRWTPHRVIGIILGSSYIPIIPLLQGRGSS